MANQFLHGVQVLDILGGSAPIQVSTTSVIGIIGTAPNADLTKFPLNTPVLIAGSLTQAAGLDTVGTGLGTLPGAVNSIINQFGAAIVVINVADSAVPATQLANILGGVNATTGAYTGCWAFLAAENVLGFAPRILIAPGFTQTRTAGGVTSMTVGAQGANYSATPVVTITGGGGGSGATATATVVAGAITKINITNPGQNYTAAPTVTITDATGTGATATATYGTVGNGVVAELLGIAQRLRAHIFADGPGTNDADAIAYSGDFGARQVYLVDPPIIDPSGNVQWSSAVAAGLQAKIDNNLGFWWSPSNQTLNGVTGTTRPIDFKLGDSNCRANLLNESNVATIIRNQGFRLWGNRTLSSIPQYQFLCVSRTVDIIDDSVQKGVLWAVDQGITKNFVEAVVEYVNDFLRTLKSKGAILGGSCWADPALNTASVIASGQIYFNFNFTPAYPAEQVTFQSAITNQYVASIFNNNGA